MTVVREEIARHKREIADHAIQTARHRLGLSRTTSAALQRANRGSPPRPFGGDESGGYQLSAVPMAVLGVLSTVEAANARWYIGNRILGAISSTIPAAAPAVDASMRLISSQGTAVAIGVATGLGLTAALVGCWFPADGLRRSESGDMFRLRKTGSKHTRNPSVASDGDRCIPALD